MDFSFPARLIHPAAISLIFPVTLLLVTRVAWLRSRNAAQFLAGALIQVLLWILVSLALPDGYRPDSLGDWGCAGMIVSCALLFYLEIWALLSRGYTLSLLLALLRAERPLIREELARKYRGGAGLDWVMEHRVGGLAAAGLVRPEGDYVTLTRPFGTLIAAAYQVAIAVFGFRRTG